MSNTSRVGEPTEVIEVIEEIAVWACARARASVAVNSIGKFKTIAQLVASPMLLYHDPLPGVLIPGCAIRHGPPPGVLIPRHANRPARGVRLADEPSARRRRRF